MSGGTGFGNVIGAMCQDRHARAIANAAGPLNLPWSLDLRWSANKHFCFERIVLVPNEPTNQRTNEPTNLVGLLQTAGESDMAAIDKQIREIDARIAELKNEKASFVEVRKIIAVRLHGKPATKKKQWGKSKSKESGDASELAKRIYDLLQTKGPRALPLIAIDLGTTAAAVGRCVSSCDWFVKSENGTIRIATQ